MKLNEKLKELRIEQNLTQQQLADQLYVSKQTICRWEKGARCPDLITAYNQTSTFRFTSFV